MPVAFQKSGGAKIADLSDFYVPGGQFLDFAAKIKNRGQILPPAPMPYADSTFTNQTFKPVEFLSDVFELLQRGGSVLFTQALCCYAACLDKFFFDS